MFHNKIKVLLIDDEQEFVSALAERLAIRGVVPRIAENGESGIDMILNDTFDLVILDLIMPGISGLGTLRQIKSLCCDLPVILLTGHGSTKEGMEGMRLGAFDFLMKPLDMDELVSRMKMAVGVS